MSEITSKIASMTKSASKATGDLFKTTKLNLSLSNEQSALNKCYAEIGKKVHEIYKYGGTLGELFDKFYGNILAHEAKMEDIKAQIALIRGVRECPTCNKPVERTSEFCSKCGTSLIPIGTPHEESIPESSYETPPPSSHASQSPPPPAVETATPPLPVPSHPPLSTTPSVPPAAATRTCRVCGAANDATTKFCLSCGRIVD